MGLLNTLFIPVCLMYCLVLVQCIRRPVIGILMQKADPKNVTRETQYIISANYVKALEGSGAMVVPVLINKNVSYYRRILKKINGLLFPGGSANLQDPTDIGRAGMILYRLAAKLNDRGVHFPILGLCEGFQLLAEASAGLKPLLKRCKGLWNVGRCLKFIIPTHKSYLYRKAPKKVIKILKHQPVTANFHSYCLTRKTLKDHRLESKWRVITVDHDHNGLEFISSMEHKRYPFAGLQFHPEKSMYDLAEGFKFRTDYDAIVANRWFYDWFVEESKKNRHVYSRPTNHIMENYCPSLVHEPGLGMFEKYFFFFSLEDLFG